MSWKILPASVGIVLAIGVITTYVIAVYKGHVDAVLPYISDTGVELPERCIFSEFVNLAAILAFATMVLRYKLVSQMSAGRNHRLNTMNKVSLFLALFSSIGLSLVANFQEQGMEIVHLIGACLVFGFGVLYALLDTSISYKMYPEFNGLYICRVRLVVALCSAFCLFAAGIAGGVSSYQWKESGIDVQHSRHWKPADPGYAAHLMSTACEWGLALFFGAYFFTHIRDFDKFDVSLGLTFYVAHLDMDPSPPVVVRSTLDRNIEEPDEQTRLLQ